MSVQIILSAKQIELDDKNLGVLNIKATFLAIAEPTAIFYKVRTNFKDLVQVRPSYGVISQSVEDDCIATMNIRYLGQIQQLKKMKLQFSWVWGTLTRPQLQKVNQKKLHHTDFKELYDGTKQKMDNQKTQLLLFTSKYLDKEKQESLIINQEQKQEAQNDSQPEEEIQNQKDSYTKTYENSAVRQKQLPSLKQENSLKPVENKGVIGKKVIILVLISFILGVFLGMKLEDYRVAIFQESSIFDKIPEPAENKNQQNSQPALNQTEGDLIYLIESQPSSDQI